MPEPAVRRAMVADTDMLVTLGRRSFTETFGHLYSSDDLAAFLDGHSRERWAAELGDPGHAIFIAEDEDGDTVGYAKLAPPKPEVTVGADTIELRQFYVLAKWHGSGLAPRLMAAVIAEARARNARDLTLTVFVDNERAKRFYARYGFEDIGRYAFMVGTQEDEDRIMRLTLDD